MPDAAYLSAADLRSVKPLDDTTRFPSALLDDFVSEFEEIVEQHLGAAQTPRTATYTANGVRGTRFELPHVQVTAVSAVTLDGTALSSGQRGTIVIDKAAGSLHYPGGWWADTVVVSYTHGLTAVPAPVLRACKEYVRAKALKSTGNQPREAAGPAGVDGSTYPAAATTPTGVREADRLIGSVRDYRIVIG